mmetsp:Transcript_4976/g.8639  ORF Transcript_4976/g.8639 Transcript_4976/m.8639 type:complete len:237 (-) Transcript_4976:1614-2324(-)
MSGNVMSGMFSVRRLFARSFGECNSWTGFSLRLSGSDRLRLFCSDSSPEKSLENVSLTIRNETPNAIITPTFEPENIMAGSLATTEKVRQYRLYWEQLRNIRREYVKERVAKEKLIATKEKTPVDEAVLLKSILERMQMKRNKMHASLERQRIRTERIQARKASEQAVKTRNRIATTQERTRSKLELIGALCHASTTWITPQTLDDHVDSLMERIFPTEDSESMSAAAVEITSTSK